MEKHPKIPNWSEQIAPSQVTTGFLLFSNNISILTKWLHREGTMPMDDHILTNHVLIVASHFNTIFDESIKKILPSKTRNCQQDSRQKGDRKENHVDTQAPGLSDVFDLSRIDQVARPHAKARAGEDKGFSALIRLESTCIPSKSCCFFRKASPNSRVHY